MSSSLKPNCRPANLLKVSPVSHDKAHDEEPFLSAYGQSLVVQTPYSQLDLSGLKKKRDKKALDPRRLLKAAKDHAFL